MIHKYSPTFEFITQWGVKPTTPGQFHWPNDIAVDNNGNIFVADTNNRRVQKFNPYGVFLTQWEINYDGPNLTWPIKIALDSTGNVYVLDLIHSQVQKFDSNGNKITNWKIQEGIIAVNQDYPTGIAIFEDQYIYISGGHNNLLHKFNLSDGSHVKNWGGLGSSTGKFNYPVDVAVDSDGCVYVADANNYRIQKFDENGNYLTDWGVPGEMEGQFNDVTSIITDANGFVYVLDSVNRNIQAFTKGGYYVSRWNTLSLKSEEQLASPRGFALDNDGNIYISDTYNHRIQVLAPGLPELDPETGLILNGSFEPVEADSGSAMIMSEASLDLVTTQNSDRGAVVGLDHWTYGGDLPVNRTTNTYEGNYSVQLGLPEEANEQGISSAWITQVFYVPYDGIPVLTFNYNVFTKDSIDQSDFIVEIQDGVGLSNKAVVVRDGFRPSAPGETPEGTVELGWKSVVFSLGRYRGRFIRLAISNRIMSPNSQGIWSYVENISVSTDGTSFSLPLKSFLPLLIR